MATKKLQLGRSRNPLEPVMQLSRRAEKLDLTSAVREAQRLEDGVQPTDALVKMTRTGTP